MFARYPGELQWVGPNCTDPVRGEPIRREPIRRQSNGLRTDPLMTLILDQQTTLDPTVIDDVDVDAFFDTEDLWAIIVWNDDVTTFQTVIQAFVEIFNHSVERADQLAWTIHRTGKAVAAIRPKEEAEAAVRDLHRRKISASLAPA
jgi:ATP-dependent Clp protease adaptor protein ClpS